MRILLTSPTFPPFNSGLGNAAAQQAASLLKTGHDVVVATGGETRCSRRDRGIRIEEFVLTGADSVLQPIKGDSEGYIDFLRSTPWDVVLLNAWQNWATDLALQNIQIISGRKFVYSHCISTNIFFPHRPLRSLIRYLAWRPYWWRLPSHMKRLDGLIFLASGGSDSRFDDLELARKYGVPFHVVPNSLSPVAAMMLERPPQPFDVRDRIIAVGSYQWQKGFDFVLQAYAASRARHQFPLHLYGQKHSSYSATLMSLVARLGLPEGSVVFHEGVSGEALLSIYRQARLLLSGSHTECQPLVLLDANATGTPFIARTTGCVACMAGGIGVRSPQEMAFNIDAVAYGSEAWQVLAEAGRRAARDIYHPDHAALSLVAALSGGGN